MCVAANLVILPLSPEQTFVIPMKASYDISLQLAQWFYSPRGERGTHDGRLPKDCGELKMLHIHNVWGADFQIAEHTWSSLQFISVSYMKWHLI